MWNQKTSAAWQSLKSCTCTLIKQALQRASLALSLFLLPFHVLWLGALSFSAAFLLTLHSVCALIASILWEREGRTMKEPRTDEPASPLELQTPGLPEGQEEEEGRRFLLLSLSVWPFSLSHWCSSILEKTAAVQLSAEAARVSSPAQIIHQSSLTADFMDGSWTLEVNRFRAVSLQQSSTT